MLIDCCMCNFCNIFDIDVNGGENDMILHSIRKEVEHDEDANLVFLELRCFSFMLPSMPKGEIVSTNVDAMTEHYKTLL